MARGLDAAVRARLRAAHLVLLAEPPDPALVDRLVRYRVDDARLLEGGRGRLGRNSAITGPYPLPPQDKEDVRVPLGWTSAYAIESPTERDAGAFDDIGDPVVRAWWMRAFPTGKPFREEGEAVDLALALARALGGAVRPGGTDLAVVPDPLRHVDLTVWSAYWLEPDRLLALLAPALPGAHIDVAGRGWLGPAPERDSEPWSLAPDDPTSLDLAEALDEQVVADIEAVATAHDAHSLSGADVVDGFAVEADEGLMVGAMQEDAVPPWVRARVARQLRRPRDPVVTYTVRWLPADPTALELEEPPAAFRRARERARSRVRVATRIVSEAVLGVVTDLDGFELDRYTL